MDKERTFLTVDEAADYLGLKKSYLYKLIHFRRIPFLKYGPKSVRFRSEDLKEWRAARTQEIPSTEQQQARAANYCLTHP